MRCVVFFFPAVSLSLSLFSPHPPSVGVCPSRVFQQKRRRKAPERERGGESGRGGGKRRRVVEVVKEEEEEEEEGQRRVEKKRQREANTQTGRPRRASEREREMSGEEQPTQNDGFFLLDKASVLCLPVGYSRSALSIGIALSN